MNLNNSIRSLKFFLLLNWNVIRLFIWNHNKWHHLTPVDLCCRQLAKWNNFRDSKILNWVLLTIANHILAAFLLLLNYDFSRHPHWIVMSHYWFSNESLFKIYANIIFNFVLNHQKPNLEFTFGPTIQLLVSTTNQLRETIP